MDCVDSKKECGSGSPFLSCLGCGYTTQQPVLHKIHLQHCSHAKAQHGRHSKLPDPPVKRNYCCRICAFRTSKAKLFLYHRRFAHSEDISVFPCNRCEYASKNKSKTQRHRKLVHKDFDDSHELRPANDLVGIEWSEIGLAGSDTMADENQNEVMVDSGKKVLAEGMEVDEFTEEDDDFEDVDEEVSFRSVEKRKYLGENFHPKPSENAYEYIMCVRDESEGQPLYQCRMCPFESSHKYKIASHIRSLHMKKAVFKCPYCDFVCRRKIEWCVHKTSHTNKFVFSCDECLYRTTMRRNFDRHFARHQNGGPIKCPRCTYSSTGEAAIQRHITDYHTSPEKEKENLILRQEAASDVGSPSVRGSSNNNNINNTSLSVSESGDGEFPCEQCPMQFRTEAKLRQHMIAHSDQAPHGCPVCTLSYKRPADLNRHMKRKHNLALQDYRKNPGAASLVANVSLDQDHEEGSYSMGSPSQSPQEYIVAEDEDLEEHIDQPLNLSVKYSVLDLEQDEPLDLSTPKKKSSEKVAPPSPREFGCHMCDSSYRYQSDLNEHLRLIHYIHVEAEEEEDMEEDREWRLHCQYCPFKGQYPAEVERHTKETHGEGKTSGGVGGTGTGSCWWGGCVFCPFRAAWKCDMRRHLQRHHATEIQMCGGDLDSVLAETYHDGEEDVADYNATEDNTSKSKPSVSPASTSSPTPMNTNAAVLKCTSCAFVCTDSAELANHSTMHENLKRFMCAHCGHRSNWLWDVRKHIKSTHPGASLDVVELPEEEARVTLEEYLQKHGEESDVVEEKVSPMPVKATDRCRPFMCSVCGRRSNWRWDMNKHIRSLHPTANLITLSDKKARETFDDYERSLQQQTLINNHTKAVQQQQQQQQQKSRIEASSNAYESDEVRQLVLERLRPFKCTICGKRSNWRWDLGKHIKSMHGGQGGVIVIGSTEARASVHQHEIQQLRKELGKSQHSSTSSPSPLKRPPSQTHIDISKLKRFKCSVCAYRSNFRSDIGRHIKRKHHRGIAKVTQLEPDEAAATLAEYHQVWARKKFVPTPTTTSSSLTTPDLKRRRMMENESTPSMKPTMASTPVKVRALAQHWQCKRCEFQDEERSAMEQHVAEQHPRACMCKECGDTFTTEAALKEHCREEEHDGMNDSNDAGDTAAATVTDTPDMKEVKEWKEVSRACTVVQYRCRECELTAPHRATLQEHVVQVHSSVESAADCIEQFYKVCEAESERVQCSRCPFTAASQSILDRHATYHQPRSENPYKCPFCSYWVAEAVSLNHHMRLHANNDEDEAGDVYDFSTDMDDSQHVLANSTLTPPRNGTSNGRSKHFCEYCPYVSANRNDYLYHKQFHRPKPAAPFKCDHCQYWVSLRRLLKQHVKVHTVEYQMRYRNGVSDRVNMSATADFSSPCKSDSSALSTDEVMEMALYKQHIIASKITSVAVTPEKVRSDSYVPQVGTPVVKCLKLEPNGQFSAAAYRTMLKCRFCPYRNVRATNLKLHEKMHGNWATHDGQKLLKCTFCDYHVGNAGVLARHIKVHSEGYDPSQEDMNDDVNDILGKGEGDGSEIEEDLPVQSKEIQDAIEANKTRVRHNEKLDVKELPSKCDYYLKESLTGDEVLLEKATFQKLCCERCPYSTMKRSQFEKHIVLHNSKQRYTCEYCDYSVPSYHLLLQHKQLHLMPNRNLLAAQSIGNLHKLPEIPADVAIAGYLNGEEDENHSSMDLFEHSKEFSEPKQTFRCDKCPYNSIRRSLLLQHLKCHMIKSELSCPYCSYSVSRPHLLNQHIRVHFNAPGSEMSALSKANIREMRKFADREEEYVDIELKKQKSSESSTERKSTDAELDVELQMADDVLGDGNDSLELHMETDVKNISGVAEMLEGDEQVYDLSNKKPKLMCQYCERVFSSKAQLSRHEMQHTVGSGCD